MGRNKIDRTGEIGVNNFGSEVVIVGYRNNRDIDVYFTEYDWIAKGVQYQNFKNGEVKCPYEKRYLNVGYIGEGNYKTKENGKFTRIYNTWSNILKRCYDEEFHKKQPTYEDCEVSEEFHSFQNFGTWDEENYYKIENEVMCLDKDILVKHNKIYSPETCIYVPQTINNLFTKNDRNRGGNPIGVSLDWGKYRAQCSIYNFEKNKKERKYLGVYDTQKEAFEIYKQYKEKNIKEVADYFKSLIPKRLYDGMYSYEVEITD